LIFKEKVCKALTSFSDLSPTKALIMLMKLIICVFLIILKI
jgi:hypothetical protein